MEFNTELLHKYSIPGPRYTSYPTAPYFSESFGEQQWQEELETTETSSRDLSLYVHIPFCATLCYYCGCNMIAGRDYGKASEYLGSLFQEIDRVAEFVAPGRMVRQIHWGGGTPTYLHPDDIRRLFGHLAARFSVGAEAEIGCEVDPRKLTWAHVQALKDAGFNRLSLGVQDAKRLGDYQNRIVPGIWRLSAG